MISSDINGNGPKSPKRESVPLLVDQYKQSSKSVHKHKKNSRIEKVFIFKAPLKK